MAMTYYPAIIEQAEDGFTLYFPDFPGCVSGGETVDDAARSAEVALRLHVRGMIDDGDPPPPPTPLERLVIDPAVKEVARLLVRLEAVGKVLRFNATMDESLLQRVDQVAKAHGYSRSAFLAEAARRMIGF